jgi:hypothetical protein
MAASPSTAEDRFSELMRLPPGDRAASLRELADLTDPAFETDWLEFKGKPSGDSKTAELWAKALSGFANSGGGLVVWGLDARKHPATGVDAVSGEQPISNPLGFKARLIELLRGATNPPLANVQIEVVTSGPAEGFVICLVPEGRFKPYRAEIAGRPQYYIRAGDQFVVPPPALLRTLFYPQQQPVFRVEAKLSWMLGLKDEPCPDMARFSCNVYIQNQGTATARDVYLALHTNLNDLSQLRNNETWTILTFSPKQVRFIATRPIHPGMTVHLGCLEWRTSTMQAGPREPIIPTTVENRLVLHFHAENQAAQRAEISFDGSELIEQHREYSKAAVASSG